MISLAEPQFLHRLNRDGTFDSICTRCIKTIASHYSEPPLTVFEQRHKCEGLETRMSALLQRAPSTGASFAERKA
jgi:hypothetical protein